MKKIVLLTSLVAASYLNADILNIEAGVGVWNGAPTGNVNYKNTITDLDKDFGLSRENLLYGYVDIKHPVFILPNLRLEYNDLSFSNTTSKTFVFGSETFSGTTSSQFDLVSFDAITYWNLLDSFAWNVDLGLDFKYITGDIQANSGTILQKTDVDFIVPHIYGNVRYGITSEVGFEASGKYFTFDGATSSDISAKVDYDVFNGVTLEAGYKAFKMDINHSFADKYNIDTTFNIKFAGPFVGVAYRF